jgi:hypothetical protein
VNTSHLETRHLVPGSSVVLALLVASVILNYGIRDSCDRPQKLVLTFMLLKCEASFGRWRYATWSLPRNKIPPAASVANPSSKEWRLTPYQESLSFWHWLKLLHSIGGRDAARYAAGRCLVHTSLPEQRRRLGNVQ